MIDSAVEESDGAAASFEAGLLQPAAARMRREPNATEPRRCIDMFVLSEGKNAHMLPEANGRPNHLRARTIAAGGAANACSCVATGQRPLARAAAGGAITKMGSCDSLAVWPQPRRRARLRRERVSCRL